jgi:hypothetical protein
MFPQAFTLADNLRVALAFEALLQRQGFQVPHNSPLEKGILTALEMFETYKDKSIHDLKSDCRERWRQAFSFVEIARKILKAEHHPDFGQLVEHLGLLTEGGDLSQFSMISISATPKEKDTNNKIFELFVAGILFRMLSNIELDKVKASKGDKRNPDVIGKYKGKRWGFACKTSHTKSPKSFVERIEDGIAQIEAADVERGIVVVNLKNLIPHDEIWPAEQDQKSGEWIYASYIDKEATVIQVRRVFSEFEQEVYALTGGRQAFVNKFDRKNAIPLVLMFYCTVAGHSPRPGVTAPMIVKQLTEIGAPSEQVDSESATVMDLFNDYLHDRIE